MTGGSFHSTRFKRARPVDDDDDDDDEDDDDDGDDGVGGGGDDDDNDDDGSYMTPSPAVSMFPHSSLLER